MFSSCSFFFRINQVIKKDSETKRAPFLLLLFLHPRCFLLINRTPNNTISAPC
uniref:Uncharacterized protein n=1 Tax=Arundo donax TaxID=35708 RepID=A0A0A9ABR4_ARUDO